MKIDSLSNLSYVQDFSKVGNAVRGINQGSKSKSVETQNTGSLLAAQSPKSGAFSPAGLTSAERAYFAKLFPDSLSQISSHNTYSPTGLNSSLELGQMINRKV
ncbi:MAG: hypothetical protein ACLP05_09135 [Candidatus Kryptoniota bacterium]